MRPAFGIRDVGDWWGNRDCVPELQRMMTDDDECVVPRDAACLFVRGVNDPVLNPAYVDALVEYLRARTTAQVESRLFEKSQHAMAIIEEPLMYKRAHVEDLLALVPEWSGSRGDAEGHDEEERRVGGM